MRRFLMIFLLFLALGVANAGQIENLLRNSDFSAGLDGWEILGAAGTAETGDGAVTLRIAKGNDAGLFKLQQPIRTMEVGHIYRCYFTVDCELPQTRPMVISYRMRNKPKNLGLFRQLPLRQGLQKIFVEIIPGLESDDPQDPPVLSLYLGELDGKVVLSDMFLVDLTRIDAEPPPFSEEWTVFGLIRPDDAAPVDAIPEGMPGLADGDTVMPALAWPQPEGDGFQLDLRREAGASRRRFRDAAMLYNRFHSDAARVVPVGFGADWWMEIHLNGKLVYSTMDDGNAKKPVSPANHLVFLPVKPGENLLAVKVVAGSEGWGLHWGAVTPPPPSQVFTAKEGYIPIDTGELAVKAGTALDLSALVDAPAGKYGRAVITGDGHVAFENNPAPQRFHGFSGEPDEKVWKDSSDSDFPRLAAEYARAIRAQGYNLFRMHGFDAWLMAHSTEDMKPLPRYFDRWDRMVHEMKQQGVYLQLNLFAFWLFSSEREWFQVAEKRMANKVLFIIGEPTLRERFAKAAKMVLDHVNPYTGLAWKDDPVFIAVEYYNEIGLGIEYAPVMERSYPEDFKFLKRRWREFLRDKYAALPAEKCPHPASVMADPPLPKYWDRSQLRVDYDEFWYTNLKAAYRFCDQVMKECGYDGLTLQCPMPALRCSAVSWESVQIVDAHGYHCHPDGGEQPGAVVSQASSIADGASLFRYPFGGRIYGRPFFFNEHNYVFRNPYQYEKPVALDAYAALNDWDSLAIHSGAVALRNDQRASSFHAANNPVLRAGEFLSSLFFLRRDVAAAGHRAAVALSRDYVFSIGRSSYALAPTQSRVGLLTNVATLYTDLPPYGRVPTPPPPDLLFTPAGTGEIIWHGWFAQARETAANDPSLESLVTTMRERAILPADNCTDLEREIYQSQTGQITLFARERKMTVVTPKSEAVALPAGGRQRLGTLEVVENSVNSLIGLAAVDDLPLSESERMVLVLSTRIANTGMQHDSTGAYLRVIGTLPILYQCGRYDLRINRRGRMRCYALSLAGERREEVPVERTPDGMSLKVDLAGLKHGPTPFFEIVIGE